MIPIFTNDPAIHARRTAIWVASNRDGIFIAVPELQAECAVLGHIFVRHGMSSADPLGQSGWLYPACQICGAKNNG